MRFYGSAKKGNSIDRRRTYSFFITCLFFLSYFSAFVELAAIPHRIINVNGEINFIHVSPHDRSDQETIDCDNAPSAFLSKIQEIDICQIQKNLMNSHALSPDINCNQNIPLDIIAFIFPYSSVNSASVRDLYLLAPKNSPPIS